jgi:hypothetical protein
MATVMVSESEVVVSPRDVPLEVDVDFSLLVEVSYV